MADADAVVVGAGPVGMTAAVALAKAGAATVLVAPAERGPDRRTSALLTGSVRLLERLGIWERVATEAAPLTRIRLIDETGGLLSGPEIVFDAAEIGEAAFGYNIRNEVLNAALTEVAAGLPGLSRVVGAASDIRFGADRVEVTAGEVTVSASLAVGADGRGSPVRKAAGIGTREWRYQQAALVCDFSHAVPHEDTSNEFQAAGGPFTTVPLADGRSSLVWVDRPEVIDAAVALDEAALAAEIERRCRSILGRISDIGPRQRFPLGGLHAHRLAGGRVVLVGEAAHALPPIAAQGLNLGIADVAVLADLAARHLPLAGDLGSAAVTDAYAARRRGDVAMTTFAVDILNRSLSFAPLGLARGLGLAALRHVGPLRRFAMRRGVARGAVPARLGA